MEREQESSYPKDKWSVLGYILVHPRTWCLLLALAFAWQCFGLRAWVHRNLGQLSRLEIEADAHAHDGE